MGQIVVEEAGVLVWGAGMVRWESIEEAIAYKSDLLTTDLICLQLRLAGGSDVIVHEEMEGWEAFVEVLPNHLEGCTSYRDWYSQIVLPPFEPNVTCIWRKNGLEPVARV